MRETMRSKGRINVDIFYRNVEEKGWQQFLLYKNKSQATIQPAPYFISLSEFLI